MAVRHGTYGFTSRISPNFFLASSVLTVGGTITSSPAFDRVSKILRIVSRLGLRRTGVSYQPIDRGGYTSLISGLERVNNTENLSCVTSSRGRVGHDQADLLGRVDDEHGADGEGDALAVHILQILSIDHVVEEGDLALSICDNGELDLSRGDFVDVLDPLLVGIKCVGTLERRAN